MWLINAYIFLCGPHAGMGFEELKYQYFNQYQYFACCIFSIIFMLLSSGYKKWCSSFRLTLQSSVTFLNFCVKLIVLCVRLSSAVNPQFSPAKLATEEGLRNAVLGRPLLDTPVIASGNMRPTQKKWGCSQGLSPDCHWFNQGNEDIMKYLLSQYATH